MWSGEINDTAPPEEKHYCRKMNEIYSCERRCCHGSSSAELYTVHSEFVVPASHKASHLAGALFCGVPKNGISQWVGFLYRASLEAAAGYDGFLQECCVSMREQLDSIRASQRRITPASWAGGAPEDRASASGSLPAVPRGVVLRNPLSRYRSAFLDKYLYARQLRVNYRNQEAEILSRRHGTAYQPARLNLSQEFDEYIALLSSPENQEARPLDKPPDMKGPLNQHWRSQASFCGLWLGVRFDYVWKMEDFPYLPIEQTLVPFVGPHAANLTISARGGRELTFPETLRPESFSAHSTVGRYKPEEVDALWTFRRALATMRARPMETRLLWPLYGLDLTSELQRLATTRDDIRLAATARACTLKGHLNCSDALLSGGAVARAHYK